MYVCTCMHRVDFRENPVEKTISENIEYHPNSYCTRLNKKRRGEGQPNTLLSASWFSGR